MYRCVGYVVAAIKKSDLDQVFGGKRAMARDEVHHSVWCLLDVPHLVRLSRLCRGRPRPCLRRLPAGGALFVIRSKYPNCLFVRKDTCNSGK